LVLFDALSLSLSASLSLSVSLSPSLSLSTSARRSGCPQRPRTNDQHTSPLAPVILARGPRQYSLHRSNVNGRSPKGLRKSLLYTSDAAVTLALPVACGHADDHDARRQAATTPMGFEPARDPTRLARRRLSASAKESSGKRSAGTVASLSLAPPPASPGPGDAARLRSRKNEAREKAGGCGSPADQQNKGAQKQRLQLQRRLANVRAHVCDWQA
jgi:hypothetical protein